AVAADKRRAPRSPTSPSRKNQTQEMRIRKSAVIAPLPYDNHIHRWNDEHSLISGSNCSDQIPWRFPTKTCLPPILAFPRLFKHFLHIHLASIRGLAIQPETHSKHRIDSGSSETLRQVFRTHNLTASVFATIQNQLSQLRPLQRCQTKSAG